MTTNLPTVRFLRVIGHRAKQQAVVLAVVDDNLVRWRIRDGWTCTCPTPEGHPCTHATTVAHMVDPRVTGEAQ